MLACGGPLGQSAVVDTPPRGRKMPKGQVKTEKKNKQKLTTKEKQEKKKEKQAGKK
jgi:hypothetical protein